MLRKALQQSWYESFPSENQLQLTVFSLCVCSTKVAIGQQRLPVVLVNTYELSRSRHWHVKNREGSHTSFCYRTSGPLCPAPSATLRHARLTQSNAQPSQHSVKIRGWHLITIITIYAQDTIHIRPSQADTDIYKYDLPPAPVLGLHGRKV